MAGDSMTFQELASMVEVGHQGEKKSLNTALDDVFEEAVKAVEASGGKGSFSVAVHIKPGARSEITVTAAIKRSIPEPGSLGVPLYLDRRGRVVAEDPNQGRLPLGSIDPKGSEAA